MNTSLWKPVLFKKKKSKLRKGFTGDSAGKESTSNVGDLGSIPGLGRFPGGGHGFPLHDSCLENPHGQRSLAGYIQFMGSQRVRHDWATKHKLRKVFNKDYLPRVHPKFLTAGHPWPCYRKPQKKYVQFLDFDQHLHCCHSVIIGNEDGGRIIWLHKHLFHRWACFPRRNFLHTLGELCAACMRFSFMGKLSKLQISSGMAENAKQEPCASQMWPYLCWMGNERPIYWKGDI